MRMKALIEIEITGDFEEPLTNDAIVELLDDVVCEGARKWHLDGTYKIIQVYKDGDSN